MSWPACFFRSSFPVLYPINCFLVELTYCDPADMVIFQNLKTEEFSSSPETSCFPICPAREIISNETVKLVTTDLGFADHSWRKENHQQLPNICMKSAKFSLMFTNAYQHGYVGVPETLSPAKTSTGFSPSRGNGDSCSKTKSIWIPNKIAELSLKIKILECRIHEVF